MIFKNLCWIQRIVIGFILSTIVYFIFLHYFLPNKVIDFDDFNKIEWNNTEREINLRNMISWELSKQLQSAALAATMFLSFLGIISRNLNIQTDKEANFYLGLIGFLNVLFYIGIFRFLHTYSSIAQMEFQLHEKVSNMLRIATPLYYYILNKNLLVHKYILFVLIPVINIVWLLIGYYKIEIECEKNNCACGA